MIRTQLQLSEEQATALRELAAREGRSMADLVREGIELLFARRRPRVVQREERVERSLEVIGRYRSGTSDLGRRHDEAFVEAIEG